MPSPIYSHSVAVADTRGLDPLRFRVTLLVDREDGKPLTKADRDAIAAAFADAASPAASPAPPEASEARPSRGKGKPAGRPRQASASKPRKSKPAAKTAARRPSR